MDFSSPYKTFPSTSFWSRSVATADPSTFDPVVSDTIKIARSDRIATAGSCFAQHISRHLKRSGYCYYVTEICPDFFPEEIRTQFGFGVFSARYGNIYTARQLLQLFDRAYDKFSPLERYWEAKSGIVDAFRPFIQPGGFDSVRELEIDQAQHFAAVRTLFEQADVFVFTLGLTEAWVSRADGSVFPVCPGSGVGTFDESKYQFSNFDYEAVVADMESFLERVRSVNPKIQIILTVSPVPLIATAEHRHVLVSTVYSKSVLRAAAGRLESHYPFVSYFPSFEIITGQQAGNSFFASDRRTVLESGVEAVMRIFMKHYCSVSVASIDQPPTDRPPDGESVRQVPPSGVAASEVVCDEERLDALMRGVADG
jgi:hypothetical protein